MSQLAHTAVPSFTVEPNGFADKAAALAASTAYGKSNPLAEGKYVYDARQQPDEKWWAIVHTLAGSTIVRSIAVSQSGGYSYRRYATACPDAADSGFEDVCHKNYLDDSDVLYSACEPR